MSENFYITTPIYYVNDAPHIGHAYTNVVSDVLARYHRLKGQATYFLTGTDEHGQKIEKTAQSKGREVQAFTDEVSEHFRALNRLLQLTNDDFIRTTEPRHIEAAQALWNALMESGAIYLGSYAGWYSVRDEAFYGESELVDGKAPTGAPVEWVEEPSYFFRLSAWQEPLLALYRDNPDFIWPESRRNEVIRFVEGGLTDLSISRTSFSWGVPVPEHPDHVMYVWLDALTNYISALGYPDQTSALYQQFWPASVHVVGKDILRFHAVYWPAFLMAAGLPVPHQVLAHGWWTNEGQKISKSLGNVIDPFALVERYGIDAVRYFMMREVPLGQDGNFSDANLIHRINAELGNTIGNLAQRTLTMLAKECEGRVPLPAKEPEAYPLIAQAHAAWPRYREHMDNYQFHLALEVVQELAMAGNAYIDAKAPWALKKTDPTAMQEVLLVVMELLAHTGHMLLPFIEGSACRLLEQLGIEKGHQAYFQAMPPTWMMRPGASLPRPEVIFPRLER